MLILLAIFLVGALKITTFTNGLNGENITFDSNEEHIRNISIYRYANVTSATMNLSGHKAFFNHSLVFPHTSGTYSQNSQTNRSITHNLPTVKNVSSIGFTYRGQLLDADIIRSEVYVDDTLCYVDYFDVGDSGNQVHVVEPTDCYSPIEGQNITFIVASPNGWGTIGGITTPNANWSTYGARHLWVQNTKIVYDENGVSLENTTLQINSTNIWSYNGIFNHINNKTDDFSSIFNTALNSGLCDCVGCTLEGNNCTINFTFHSDSGGKFEYSDININWVENIVPNVTIIKPTGTQLTFDSLLYNITTGEDYESDTCIYWITRGDSIEIANKSVPCLDEITGLFSVSTDRANYVYHFWMNDTSGNINYTNSSFYVEIPSGSPEGGGGSSGSSVTIEGDKGWIMQVADGVEKYEIQMSKDSTRELEIQFENIGETERTIRLDCEDIEGEICEYITFEEDTFTLPVKKDLTTRIPFEIKLPELLEEKEYVFNIKATDDNFVDGSISVYLGVGKAGLLITTLSKLRQGFYFLIFSVIFLFFIFVFAFALPKKFPIKPFFVIIFSTILAFLGIYFT